MALQTIIDASGFIADKYIPDPYPYPPNTLYENVTVANSTIGPASTSIISVAGDSFTLADGTVQGQQKILVANLSNNYIQNATTAGSAFLSAAANPAPPLGPSALINDIYYYAPNNRLIVGSSFTSWNNNTAIARFGYIDLSARTITAGPATAGGNNFQSFAVDPSNPSILTVAGSFANFGTTASCNSIAQYNLASNAELATTFGAGFNNQVNKVIYDPDDGELICGGNFTNAGYAHLAWWDGATWNAFSTGVNNSVDDVVKISGNLLAFCGNFTAPYPNLSFYNKDTLSFEGLSGGDPDGRVITLVYDATRGAAGRLYIGGRFENIGGVRRPYFAVYDIATKTILPKYTNDMVDSGQNVGTYQITPHRMYGTQYCICSLTNEVIDRDNNMIAGFALYDCDANAFIPLANTSAGNRGWYVSALDRIFLSASTFVLGRSPFGITPTSGGNLINLPISRFAEVDYNSLISISGKFFLNGERADRLYIYSRRTGTHLVWDEDNDYWVVADNSAPTGVQVNIPAVLE